MERYKQIDEFPGYEVSNLGNVRNRKTGRILKPRLNKKDGYGRVALNGKDRYVHRLVAGTFMDGDHDGFEVNHIDGNKWNNNLANLEWCNRKDNLGHAVENSDLRDVVCCGECRFRDEFTICEGKPDSFFCAYGERITGQV